MGFFNRGYPLKRRRTSPEKGQKRVIFFNPLALNCGKGDYGMVLGWEKDKGGLSARDDSETTGLGNRLPAGADTQLLVDVLQVCFDGLIGNE